VEAQAALNRPAFVNELAAEWIPQIPDVAALLADSGRATRIADLGCGLGWAAIELAKAYPHLRVDGDDTDEESITRARRNAADAGVSDRVTFDVVDASSPYDESRYDLILFFECVHDMAHPVAAIGQAKAALAEGGTVIVMDERVGETRQATDGDILRHRECALVPPARSGRAGLRGGRHSDAPEPIPQHRA
jgi:SAM-dependent methyltransferase